MKLSHAVDYLSCDGTFKVGCSSCALYKTDQCRGVVRDAKNKAKA